MKIRAKAAGERPRTFAEHCAAVRLENGMHAFRRAMLAACLARHTRSRSARILRAAARSAMAQSAMLAPERVTFETDGWDSVARFEGLFELGLPGVVRVRAESPVLKRSA